MKSEIDYDRMTARRQLHEAADPRAWGTAANAVALVVRGAREDRAHAGARRPRAERM
jgi:hypothetical protein